MGNVVPIGTSAQNTQSISLQTVTVREVVQGADGAVTVTLSNGEQVDNLTQPLVGYVQTGEQLLWSPRRRELYPIYPHHERHRSACGRH